MPFRLRQSTSLDPGQLRDFARVLVRAGYLDRTELEAEVCEAARDYALPDPGTAARDLVAAATADVHAEQDSWPAVTDYERLDAALHQLSARGVVALPYVDDHWAATAELERRDDRGEPVPGIAWFTPPDVWHAVGHGMLEINLWHGDSANVAPGDQLLEEVLDVLHRHGLAAHFDEGRIEVGLRWQRRR